MTRERLTLSADLWLLSEYDWVGFVCDLKDFGQKLHETVNCAVCGMTYIRCEPVDELTHSQYHQTVFDTLKFTVSDELCSL